MLTLPTPTPTPNPTPNPHLVGAGDDARTEQRGQRGVHEVDGHLGREVEQCRVPGGVAPEADEQQEEA